MTVSRHDPAICGVCARSAAGFGYSSDQNWRSRPPIWTCDSPECLQVAKDSYSLPQDRFTRLESLASGKGGEEGGAFLDEIGKTDLAALTEAEWYEFCRRIIAGYRKALVTSLRDESPF